MNTFYRSFIDLLQVFNLYLLFVFYEEKLFLGLLQIDILQFLQAKKWPLSESLNSQKKKTFFKRDQNCELDLDH